VVNKEHFYTCQDILDFLGDHDLANLLLPDWVVFLSQLAHIAIISFECFV
jgi:hypothetical protein